MHFQVIYGYSTVLVLPLSSIILFIIGIYYYYIIISYTSSYNIINFPIKI